MKSYRRHLCMSQHRSAQTFVQCAIRGLEWIRGDGDYAVIAWCASPTVTLHADLDAAHETLKTLNGTRCSHDCRGRHELVHIEHLRSYQLNRKAHTA